MKSKVFESWEMLILEYESGGDVEIHYFRLLTTADELLRNGLVDDSEWRQMARQAADFFVEIIDSQDCID